MFVCSGMGQQWWAMGRELLAREPLFRITAEACDAAFQAVADKAKAGCPLSKVIRAPITMEASLA